MSLGFDMLDQLQNAVVNEKQTEKSKEFEYDKLAMYFGEDFNYKGILISMPKIGEILSVGESKFFNAITPFIYNSTSIRVQLWDEGKDWNKVRDIEVFYILTKSISDPSPQKLWFKNFSFDNLELIKYKDEEDIEKFALLNEESEVMILEDDFKIIAGYIRTVLDMHPKEEHAKGRTAKEWIIQEDRLNQKQNEKTNSSTLLPLVSSCVNHPGFKYKLDDLKEVGIYQFMDSVKRIKKYESSSAALNGCYSGFVDSSKIDSKTLDYMSDI
jgi:hypothetical protein